MVIEHKHAYIFCIKYCLDVNNTNMMMVQNFEIIPDKFNVVKIMNINCIT